MQIHPQFKLNGISLDKDALYEVAYSWIKEGQEFEVQAGDFLLDWLNPFETLQVKTSGSTGAPKTIHLRKQCMKNSALMTGKYFKLSPGDKALLCLPTAYIAGKMMLVRAMTLGLELDVVAPSTDPLSNLEHEHDFVAMVPLQVEASFSEIHKIKTLIIGGASIPMALRERLSKLTNDIYETYGMTETITHVAVKRVSSGRLQTFDGRFETLPEVTISKDERGCLVINAPKVSDDTVVTNDLVDLVDHKHFKWLGRFDNVINSGGVKLIPEQIEEKLSKILSHRFFVSSLPDKKLGEKLVLFIEVGKQDLIKLKQQLKNVEALSKFEIPKEFFLVKKFMETPNGKIKRRETVSHFLQH